MHTPQQALNLIFKHVRPLKIVRKPLNEALSHCLAEDVLADRDMPPADCSAMDGYAVRSSDLAKCPCTLSLTGEVAAGSPARPKVRSGTCVRVLTGANIPPGADSVVMVEHTKGSDGDVMFYSNVPLGSNIRRQGEQARKGAVLLHKGTALGPVQIGLCAAVGKAELGVHLRPNVAVLCTGRELRPVHAPVQAHELRDSNGPVLSAALLESGFPEISLEIVPDDAETLSARAKDAAARRNVILVTGGVSVGKYDFVPEVVARIGATIRFHGVAMKPGKPLLYASLPGDRHIFGLPGNPLSAITAFYEFVLPALHRMSGVPVEECRPSIFLPLTHALRSKNGRVEFALARLSWREEGPSAVPLKAHGSADIVTGARAEGTVVVPANVRELSAGSLVEFRPWRAMP